MYLHDGGGWGRYNKQKTLEEKLNVQKFKNITKDHVDGGFYHGAVGLPGNCFLYLSHEGKQ